MLAVASDCNAAWRLFLSMSDLIADFVAPVIVLVRPSSNSQNIQSARSYRGARLVRVFATDLVPELVRTGRAHEEVSAVANRPSRYRIACDRRTESLRKKSAGRCRIGAEAFVAG